VLNRSVLTWSRLFRNERPGCGSNDPDRYCSPRLERTVQLDEAYVTLPLPSGGMGTGVRRSGANPPPFIGEEGVLWLGVWLDMAGSPGGVPRKLGSSESCNFVLDGSPLQTLGKPQKDCSSQGPLRDATHSRTIRRPQLHTRHARRA